MNRALIKGTLTEVTNSYTRKVIAYIVPLGERSEKGFYEIKVLWCSDKRFQRTPISYRAWIGYKPITKKKYPMFLGMSTELDDFIAEALDSSPKH